MQISCDCNPVPWLPQNTNHEKHAKEAFNKHSPHSPFLNRMRSSTHFSAFCIVTADHDALTLKLYLKRSLTMQISCDRNPVPWLLQNSNHEKHAKDALTNVHLIHSSSTGRDSNHEKHPKEAFNKRSSHSPFLNSTRSSARFSAFCTVT